MRLPGTQYGQLSRRAFVRGAGLAGLGLLAGCGRLPGQAQQERVPRVGLLTLLSPDAQIPLRAFKQGLREYGYVEGSNLAIEYRFAEGHPERLPDLAADLARLPVDLIVVLDSQAIRAAQQATATIPVVFSVSGDPVGTGLVASLAHPGGNLTGLSNVSTQLVGKRLELLKTVVPEARLLAVLAVADHPDWRDTEVAAQALGVRLLALESQGSNDLESAFELAGGAHADGLIVFPHPVSNTNSKRIVALAARSHLPAIYPLRGYVQDGGLMYYGPNVADLHRRTAYYVDRILKGTPPADLPVEQPREFDFVINVKTAQALGLTIPRHVLLQATEPIQ